MKKIFFIIFSLYSVMALADTWDSLQSDIVVEYEEPQTVFCITNSTSYLTHNATKVVRLWNQQSIVYEVYRGDVIVAACNFFRQKD